MNTSLVYENEALTRNELKDMLDDRIPSFRNLVIKEAGQEEIQLSKRIATNIILDKLEKDQVVEIINQLTIINKRNSNQLYFLKFILTGLL